MSKCIMEAVFGLCLLLIYILFIVWYSDFIFNRVSNTDKKLEEIRDILIETKTMIELKEVCCE